MASSLGPNISDSGLVLCLDAADQNSYVGSGTVWKDMSGNNNNGTLTNGPTFSGGNGGSIVFDGVDDIITIPHNSVILDALNTQFTMCFYIKNTSPAANNLTNYSIFYKADPAVFTKNSVWFYKNRTGGVYTYLWLGPDPSSTTKAFFNFPAETVSGAGDQIIHQYVISHDATKYYGYKDGALYTSGNLTAANNITNTANFYLGSSNIVTSPFLGNFYGFQFYNRALSATEVLQNYNATKTRFRL